VRRFEASLGGVERFGGRAEAQFNVLFDPFRIRKTPFAIVF
jgi:hypothetical protein